MPLIIKKSELRLPLVNQEAFDGGLFKRVQEATLLRVLARYVVCGVVFIGFPGVPLLEVTLLKRIKAYLGSAPNKAILSLHLLSLSNGIELRQKGLGLP